MPNWEPVFQYENKQPPGTVKGKWCGYCISLYGSDVKYKTSSGVRGVSAVYVNPDTLEVWSDYMFADKYDQSQRKPGTPITGPWVDEPEEASLPVPEPVTSAAEPSSTITDKVVRNWNELEHALPALDDAASDVLYDQLQDLPGWTRHVPRTKLLRIHAGGSTWLVFEGGLNKIILLRPDQLTAEAGKLPRNQLEHVFVSNDTAGFSYFHKAVLKGHVPADEVFGNGHGDGPGPGRTVRQALQRLLAAAFSGKVEAAAEPVAHRHGDSLFGRVLADWEDTLHRRSTGDIEAIPVLKKDGKTLFLVPADVKVTEDERYISCRLSDNPYPTGHSKYKRTEHAVQVALTEDDYDESLTRVEIYRGVEFRQTVKSIPGGNGLPSFIKFLEKHDILERAFDIVFEQKAQAAAEPDAGAGMCEEENPAFEYDRVVKFLEHVLDTQHVLDVRSKTSTGVAKTDSANMSVHSDGSWEISSYIKHPAVPRRFFVSFVAAPTGKICISNNYDDVEDRDQARLFKSLRLSFVDNDVLATFPEPRTPADVLRALVLALRPALLEILTALDKRLRPKETKAAAEPENTEIIPDLWCKFTNSFPKSNVVLTREQKRFYFLPETPGDVWGYVTVRELPARFNETVHFFGIIDHKLHYDVKVNPHATPSHDKYLTVAETKQLLQNPKQMLAKMLSMLVLDPGKAEAAAEPEADTKARFWCDVVARFPQLPSTRPVTISGRTYTAGIISHGSTLPSNMHHTHALVLRAGAETYTVNIVNGRVFLIYINDSGATDMVEIAGTEDFHRKHKTDALKLAAVFKAVAAKAEAVRKHAQAAAEPGLDAEQLLAEAADSWKKVKEVPVNTNALLRFQVRRGQARVAYVQEDIQAVAEYRVLVRHDVLALVPLMPGRQRDLAKNIGSVADLEQAIVNAFKHKPVTAAAEPPVDSDLLWYDVVDRLPKPDQTPLRVQAHGTVFELTQLLAPNRYQPPLKRNPANAASVLVLVDGKKYSISLANARIWVRNMDTLENAVGPGIYEFERKHRTAREKIAAVLDVVWRLHKTVSVQAAAEPATAQTAAEWHARVRAHLPGLRHKARLYRVGNVNVHVRFVSAEGIELTVSQDRVLQALITARPFGKIVELYVLGVVQESAEIKGDFNSAAAYMKELLRTSIKLAEEHKATAAAEPEPPLTRQQGVDYVQTHVHVPAGPCRTNMLDVGFHFGHGVYLNFRDGKQAVIDGKIGGSGDWLLLIEWCGVNLFVHTQPTVSVLRSAVKLAKHVSDYVNMYNTSSFQHIWAYLSRYRTRYGVKTAPKSALLALAERSWEVRRGRAEAAAEPAQDPREVLCRKLKAKYNLDLNPELITYMGKDGIDYSGTVNWSDKNLTRIPVRFRSVTGDFTCSGNHLTTLEHAPGHVGGDFYCSGNHLHPGTKKPAGVKGKFVLGEQTPAPVHGAVEPDTIREPDSPLPKLPALKLLQKYLPGARYDANEPMYVFELSGGVAVELESQAFLRSHVHVTWCGVTLYSQPTTANHIRTAAAVAVAVSKLAEAHKHESAADMYKRLRSTRIKYANAEDPGKRLIEIMNQTWDRVRGHVQAAAEPNPDLREDLCRKLKAKYNLELDPSKITYIGREGIVYKGSVDWFHKNLSRLPACFLEVTGNFECSSNRLTTLEGAPARVGGSFYCSGNRLTTLKHAPRWVGRDFFCCSNHLPPDTKRPDGVKGGFVLEPHTQRQAPVHGASETQPGEHPAGPVLLELWWQLEKRGGQDYDIKQRHKAFMSAQPGHIVSVRLRNKRGLGMSHSITATPDGAGVKITYLRNGSWHDEHVPVTRDRDDLVRKIMHAFISSLRAGEEVGDVLFRAVGAAEPPPTSYKPGNVFEALEEFIRNRGTGTTSKELYLRDRDIKLRVMSSRVLGGTIYVNSRQSARQMRVSAGKPGKLNLDISPRPYSNHTLTISDFKSVDELLHEILRLYKADCELDRAQAAAEPPAPSGTPWQRYCDALVRRYQRGGLTVRVQGFEGLVKPMQGGRDGIVEVEGKYDGGGVHAMVYIYNHHRAGMVLKAKGAVGHPAFQTGEITGTVITDADTDQTITKKVLQLALQVFRVRPGVEAAAEPDPGQHFEAPHCRELYFQLAAGFHRRGSDRFDLSVPGLPKPLRIVDQYAMIEIVASWLGIYIEIEQPAASDEYFTVAITKRGRRNIKHVEPRDVKDLVRQVLVLSGILPGKVQAAAEPARDYRQDLCDKLKAKYNLYLNPELITYMGRDGIDYNGTVEWYNEHLTRIPVRFRNVTGDFYCSDNHLTDLKHAPVHVGRSFDCSDNHLTSLEHAPGHVGGDFYCSDNHLTSLEHAPGHVGGDFYCSDNHLPRGTKKPKGVKGKLVLGRQTPAHVHGAAEPYPEGEGSAVAVIRKLWKTLNPARRVRAGKYEVVYRTGAHSDSRGVVVDLVEGDDLIAQIKAEPVYEYIGKRERSYVRVRLLKGSVPVPGLAVVNNITTSNSMFRFLGSVVCKHAGVLP